MGDEASVWVLADDRAGNVGQCLGVAEALGLPFIVKDIRYTRLAGLPNLAKGAGLLGIAAASRARLVPPWPDIVIAAGRRTAPVSRWIKKRSGAFLVQIMDPGPGGRGAFDLIVQPDHDRPLLDGANVLTITGAAHRVSRARLAEAAALWRPSFQHLPRPWTGLIVGGDTRRRPFSAAHAGDLARSVAALSAGGALLVTTSRRTSDEAAQALFADLPGPIFAHRWGEAGDNPYFGILALADALVVTGDSVSMCSEACAAPVPVHIWAPEGWASAKHRRLHQALFEAGYARPLPEAGGLESWTHPPLDPAAVIAAAITARLEC